MKEREQEMELKWIRLTKKKEEDKEAIKYFTWSPQYRIL